MTDWLYPTAFSSWRPGDDSPEDRALARVLASGRLTQGPEVAAFEEEFATYHGRRHGIYVNSGSSANLVATRALAFGSYKGDSIIAPAIAWSTTYAPFVQLGKQFEILDVDNTWNAPLLNGEWPGCAVVCSVLGNPAYLSDYRTIAIEDNWPLLEDNCESLGARTTEGQLTGTFGDLSTFSFFYSHQLSAIEGGMVLTNDDELARLCRLLANHGNAGFVDRTEDFDRSYDFQLMGYNVRGLELHAAVAREQLKRLDEFVEQRRENFRLFEAILADDLIPVVPQQLSSAYPSPFGLAFECGDRAARTRLVRALRAAGIDCRLPTGGSFRKHPYAAAWADQQTPRADLIHERGLFLGNAPYPIPRLIVKAVKIMRETL